MSQQQNPQSREELELAIAEKLDLNVDEVKEASFSEARLRQVFNRASDEAKAIKTQLGIWVGAMTTGMGVSLANTLAGYNDVGFAVGLLTLAFGVIVSPGGGSNLKEEVTQEIDSKRGDNAPAAPTMA